MTFLARFRPIGGFGMVALLFTLALASGCTPPPLYSGAVELAALPNPANGRQVSISVVDARTFSPTVGTGASASMNEKDKLADSAARAQVVGMWGRNHADFVLQPNQSAMSITQDAVAKALKMKGYTVVPQGGSPVSVTITKLWCSWLDGFWTIELKSEMEVKIQGDVLAGGQEETVPGNYSISSAYVVGAMSTGSLEGAMEDLAKNLQPKLQKP